MAVATYILPRFQAIDDFGRPMVGAKLYTYRNKTTTPAPTYQDAQQSAANTNPIVLDASGVAIIYLLTGQTYTFVLRDKNDAAVWSQDDVSGVATPGDIDAVDKKLREDLAGADSATLGLGMIGYSPEIEYPISSAAYQVEGIRHLFDKPAVQATEFNPAITYSDNDYTPYVDSQGESLYRHSPRIVRAPDGIYHMVYSRGKMHGYGGLTEANAVDPEGKIIYVNSRDGRKWENEQVICLPLPADPGFNPFRTVFDCHIGVTPTGRIAVVVSDIPPPSAQWGRDTGNTKYRLLINDHRGAATTPDGDPAWIERGVFFEASGDYARVYCSAIKCIPKIGGGYRMAFADYRRTSPTLVPVGMFYSDDNFDTMPQRGADIFQNAANTETDFAFFDAKLGFAVARGDFATAMTEDGGESWTQIGTAANFDRVITGNTIAPVLHAFNSRGTPSLLMGFSERGVTPRSIRWVTTSIREIRAFRDAVIASTLYTPWTIVSQSGPAFSGSGGYHSPIMFEDGSCFYVDTTDTTADPVTTFMRAQLRLVRLSIANLFPYRYGLMVGSDRTYFRQYHEDELDYVPALTGTTTTGTGTYVSQLGTNTRIGNICHLNGSFNLTGQSGFAGSLRISGVPYQSMSNQTQLVQVMVTSGMGGSWNSADRVLAAIPPQANYMVLYKQLASNNSLVGLAPADIGTNFTITLAAHYRCRFQGLQ